MKAMALNEYGENAKFEETNVDKPQISGGKVLVRILATSVNTVDTMIRAMGPEQLPFAPDLPAILGMDFAGVIEEVGQDVEGFSVGDEIYGCAGGLSNLQGALAEFMPADAKLIAHKPNSLSMKEAASLPLVAITAYEGLKRAGVRSDQKLLVHGGTGGVGHVAVQLGKYFGAQVFTTIGSEDDANIVSGYDAVAINYKNSSVEDYIAEHTDGAGFDVIYDTVGGENIIKSFEAAALNAQIATTVSLLELDLTQAHFKGLYIHVVFMLIPMLHDHKREEHGAILKDLARIVDEGALVPLIDEKSFKFDKVTDAYQHLVSGKATGKIVIEM